jgi:hypothetical protein
MNPKDEAVNREAARCRLVNVEYETVRKKYSHGFVQCLGPGVTVEVICKNTNASCRLFLHELGDDEDHELSTLIDAAGAALNAILKIRSTPREA